MSSGSLPFSSYHRADQVGSGTYGSVMVVYNDDGEKLAIKLFLPDDDDDDDPRDEDDSQQLMQVGAMREISCLRLLREENAHANIVSMVDVQPEWVDDDGGAGAGTAGCLGMALPFFQDGTLADAIEKNIFRSYPRSVKVDIAHGLLCAVAYLHDNMILHRDIKSDNVLLRPHADGREGYEPVLIDFSLAKVLPESPMWCNASALQISSCSFADGVGSGRLAKENNDPVRHTGEVGTVTYTAPEVVNGEPYGAPIDLWSVGVILLELVQNKALDALKHKQAFAQIEEILNQLPEGQPFPDLLRGLLKTNPTERLTAREALRHSLFAKFGLEEPSRRYISIAQALPFDNNDEEEAELEENLPVNTTSRKKTPKGKRKVDPVIERRVKTISKICRELDSVNPITVQAALEYSQQLFQLDDELDDPKSDSQGLLDCVVLAFRFWELEVLDLEEMDSSTTGTFANWDMETYVDNETSLFMLLDYCLYPRKLLRA